jgi:hypothetical protein
VHFILPIRPYIDVFSDVEVVPDVAVVPLTSPMKFNQAL